MNFGRTNGLRAVMAAVIAALVVSQGALADGKLNTGTLTQTIDVAALNLSSPAGAREAYRRIADAALHICSTTMNGLVGVARQKEQRDTVRPCFDAAVQGALDQVTKTTGIDLVRVAGLDPNNLVAGR
ncbi:MAG TPA: UrcA family protein [Gammaproteobacteria bacterium]|nr:UrcA family protein [Gammaproteobacteria bacterium]